MPKGFLPTLALVLGLVAAGCATGDSSVQTSTTSPAMTEVRATGFLFQPDAVTIEAGGTVVWVNDDDILHTVTSGTPETPLTEFDRQLDGRSSSTTITFDEAGDFQFFCSRHPHMTGVIRVAPTN